ncbi:MAG: hypothetical protein EXS67_06160 [Candidatus Margulisbacteria bacterium]|nr:hypothetical protein [Candidatus Margulisiibacteriota bacterium]
MFLAGITPDLDDTKVDQIILANKITLSFIFVASFYVLLFTLLNQPPLALVAFCTVGILLIAYFLNHKKQYLLSKLVLLLCTIGAVFFYNTALGQKTGIYLFNLTVISVAPMLFSKKERFYQYGVLSLATLNFFLLSFEFVRLPIFYVLPDTYIRFIYLSISSMTIGVTTLSILFFQEKFLHIIQELQKSNEKLEIQNKELLKKEKLDKQLRVAQAVQKRLLPETLPTIPGATFSAFFEPAYMLSGDYFTFRQLDKDTVLVALIDVTGKGIPAALVVSLFSKILSDFFDRYPYEVITSPSETLFTLNTLLFREQGIHVPISMIYGVLNTQTMTWTYANAGSEAGLLIRDSKVLELKTGGIGLKFSENERWENTSVPLQEGDSLLLFSDGLIDACNTKLVPFLARTDNVLCHYDYSVILPFITTKKPVVDIANAIGKAILIHQNTHPQKDDIAIISITL